MESERVSLSTGRMLLGLTAAAAVGLVTYTTIVLGLQHAVAALAFGYEWTVSQALGIGALYLVFGLPLSLILSVAVGLPVWKLAASPPLRRRRHAAALGAIIGAVIGLLVAAFGLYKGLQIYLDDTSSFDSWDWGHQVTKDGLPTLFGWFLRLIDVLYFALAGATGGVAAHSVALPDGDRQ